MFVIVREADVGMVGKTMLIRIGAMVGSGVSDEGLELDASSGEVVLSSNDG